MARKQSTMLDSSIRTTILDKIEIGIQRRMGRNPLVYMNLEKYVDNLSGDIVYQLRGYLYGKKHTDTSTEKDWIGLPATWFEMLKEAYAPAWFIKRYPVRKIRHEFTVNTITNTTNICPHLDIDSHDQQHVHVAWLEGLDTRYKY